MRCLLIPLLLALTSCSAPPPNADDFYTRDITLPGGQVLKVETMIDTRDMLRGLMFRTSLAGDHGMLFVYKTPGNYKFFMYQHLIPLDIIWIDENRRIVEIVENVPPCKTVASKCPHYGGSKPAKYALEIAAGMANIYKLKLGDTITF